jgi:hypothetical protein
MARVADTFRFRAEAVRLNWPYIAEKHGEQVGEHLKARYGDIRLTWACAKELGVPYGPFTVWIRDRSEDALKRVDVVTWGTPDGLAFWWGGQEAARVRVSCDVGSTAHPVGLFLFRTPPSLHDTIAAAAVTPSGGAAVFDLRTSGALYGLLVNGFNPVVSIAPLDDVVNDPAWKPLEVVGLPVDPVWTGSGYDTSDQGPVANLTSPEEAAVMRLVRGGPPIGWHAATQAGRFAPPWSAPDPKALVEELRKLVLPEIAALYDGSVAEYQQWQISSVRPVEAPQQGTRHSSLATTADAKPWATLNIPAHTDAFLNLASGFGTAYSQEQGLPEQIAVGEADFLVTAKYREILPIGSGSAEFAAYAPQGTAHAQTPAPNLLSAIRSGLVPPPVPDAAWGESIRLGWQRVPVTAGLGVPTESVLARYESGAAHAEPLIEKRDPSGWRPLVISPDAPPGKPGHDRTSVVDGGAEIPIGSGGRHVGYAVAVSDVYGVWSPWRDAPYDGNEPEPEGSRLISVALETRFAGTTTCPATLRLEVASEWLQRRTQSIAIVAVFFPMASPTTAPPAVLSPTALPPPGCFRRDLGISFAGDVPSGIGCVVTPLNAEGTASEVPGPAQGDGGRRYGVTADVPTLDFSWTRRWGVQLWTRRSLFVGASPTGWTPDAAHPALASAASPVPISPLPLPLPPGVPLASLPDAEGRSHGRVRWSLPASAAVRRVIVWECAETALRQTVGLPPRAPDTDAPGVRLAALWSAYDGLPAERRRNLFRRMAEVDGTLRDYDAVLPKGTTDIHLFLATTLSDTGIESAWPTGPGQPHEHLQALMAPRLRSPAPPVVRTHPAASAGVTIELSSASRIPVASFRLLRTRSEGASRRADTMGPAFAEAAAAASGTTDSVTGDPVYRATWTGPFPQSWDAWFVRAIAIPVDTIPVEAVRGRPSAASDAVKVVSRPDGPPDLAPLVVETTNAAHTGIAIRTSTAAPARAVAAGDHRVSATAGGISVTATALQVLAETPLTTPPASAATDPVIERGIRAAGRSPLALWFTRPVAADPVEVALRIVDPLGRVTERTETVPGWTPPPVFGLSLVDAFAIAGRGVAITVATDAPVSVDPPYQLAVRATKRVPWPIFPPRPPVTLTASSALPAIPPTGPLAPGGGIRFGWRHADGGRFYDIWVPLTAPLTATVALVAPDGGRVTVTATV